MTKSQLDKIIKNYEAMIIALEQADSKPTEEQILAVLLARDDVYDSLSKPYGQRRSTDIKANRDDFTNALRIVVQCDHRLKLQADNISQHERLAAWRESYNPPVGAWWWYFKKTEPPASPGRLDRFWTVLTFLGLIAAIALGVDILLRFLSIAPDTLSVLVILADVAITAAIAGGVLNILGREQFERMLGFLNIPKQSWAEARLAVAILMVLGLVGLWLTLPRFAIYYNNRGFQHYQAGNWTSAEFDFNRAIKLFPDYGEAHYNLGLLHEDLQDVTLARSEYQLAVQSGLTAAYNNLARLYILDQEYSKAVRLLSYGLDVAENEEVKYDLLKNLGWARLMQDRFAEAEIPLRDAIDLLVDKAPAHCLLAQVLDQQGETDNALMEWEICLKYASGFNPDEDVWIDMARKRLGGEP